MVFAEERSVAKVVAEDGLPNKPHEFRPGKWVDGEKHPSLARAAGVLCAAILTVTHVETSCAVKRATKHVHMEEQQGFEAAFDRSAKKPKLGNFCKVRGLIACV